MLAVSCIRLSYVTEPATIPVICAHNETESPFSNYFFTYIILFKKSHYMLYPNDSKQYYYATKKKGNTFIIKLAYVE